MKAFWKAWHGWRYRKGLFRYIEAIGRIDDLKDGPRSFAMRRAIFDRYQAEVTLCHHLSAIGEPTPRVELPEVQIARIIDAASTKATRK